MPAVPLPSVAVHLRPRDNIAVAARNLQAGLEVQHDGRTLRLGSRVNRSASTSKYISERFRATDLLKQYPNVDGVVAITHKAGCAMQYDGPDHNQLDRTLAGFAKHPNVAAYILVGLGCKTGQAIHL